MASAAPHCLRLLTQVVLLARALALFYAGSSMAARIAMIAITTRSSIRVKLLLLILPFPVSMVKVSAYNYA